MSPDRLHLRLARGAEPFSGIAILRIHAHWPESAPRSIPIEVLYDGAVAIRLLSTHDAHTGLHAFGVDLPWEAHVQRVGIRIADQMCYEGPPDHQSHPDRTLRLVEWGKKLFSPHRWQARWHRRQQQRQSAQHRLECVSLRPGPRTQRVQQLLAYSHNANFREGAPRQLRDIVEGLRERGVSPHLTVPPGEGYARAGWSIAEYRAIVAAISTELQQRQPDAVFANTLNLFPVVEACARVGVPCLWIIHESYRPALREFLFDAENRERLRIAFRLATGIVFVSQGCADCYGDWLDGVDARVIHNGVPSAPTLVERSGASFRVLTVGTVCERKGQHTLVQALARLDGNVECDIVGARFSQSYPRYVDALIHRLGLDGRVRLIPETDEVDRYYQAADVFVLTSHLEAYNRSILEAQGFGLPIIATRCPGVPEQVVWDENALPIPFADPVGLAEQLRRLHDDRALRQRLGQNSRMNYLRHSSERDMIDAYESWLSSFPRADRRAA